MMSHSVSKQCKLVVSELKLSWVWMAIVGRLSFNVKLTKVKTLQISFELFLTALVPPCYNQMSAALPFETSVMQLT